MRQKNSVKICLLTAVFILMVFSNLSYCGDGTTIRRIETNQSSYMNQTIELIVKIDLATYYNWGYRNAQKTHFAFSIEDKTGRAYVYGNKNRLNYIREKLLEANGPLICNIQIAISPKRYDAQSGQLIAELLSASEYSK